MKKVKILKRILFVLTILLSIKFNTVISEAKSYNIDKADFCISVDEHGDAIVDEYWTVTYNGDFSRFYKDTPDNYLNLLERFDSIEIMSATVNSNECTLTEDLEARKDYTYAVENKSNGNTINWYYHVSNDTVYYTVRYKVYGIAKRIEGVEDNTVVMCYRPIGAHFDKPIDNVNITVYGPVGANLSLRYINRNLWETYTSDSDIIISSDGRKSKGLLKINVGFDGNYFDNDLYTIDIEDIKYIESSNEEESNSDSENEEKAREFMIDVFGIDPDADIESMSKSEQIKYSIKLIIASVITIVASLFTCMLPFIPIFIIVFIAVRIQGKYRRLNKKNPNYIYECLNYMNSVCNNPLFTAAMLHGAVTKKDIKALLLCFTASGVIEFDGSNITVHKNKAAMLSYEESEALKYYVGQYGITYSDNNIVVYDTRQIVSNNFSIDELKQCVSRIYSNILRSTNINKNSKDIKNRTKFIEWYAKRYYIQYSYKSMNELINICRDYNSITLVSLIGNVHVQSECENALDDLDDLLDDADEYTSTHSSSSSGCSSCSSCSSCSGCGGGGAD